MPIKRAAEKPPLLRIPYRFRSVAQVLGCASKMGLSNCVIVSEDKDGAVILMSTEMSSAFCNWVLDRAKMVNLLPSQFEKTDELNRG